jgi:hypothetical protein
MLMMSSAWLSVLAKMSVLGVSLRVGKICVSTAVFMAWITLRIWLGLTTDLSSSLPV